MFIGDGAKLVRDAFELAKEKCKDQDKVSSGVFLQRCGSLVRSIFRAQVIVLHQP